MGTISARANRQTILRILNLLTDMRADKQRWERAFPSCSPRSAASYISSVSNSVSESAASGQPDVVAERPIENLLHTPPGPLHKAAKCLDGSRERGYLIGHLRPAR